MVLEVSDAQDYSELAVDNVLALLAALSLLLIGYAIGRAENKLSERNLQRRQLRDRRIIATLRRTVSMMSSSLVEHAPGEVLERLLHEIAVATQTPLEKPED
ncbi:hypothetical protein [Nocardiopsis synnemataformans]|uniref:hypothetical protein n=1 Tax=Nocardiopsis synnemataformans TaxID=61305 RepID=UPI003EBA66AC